jgi:hypothetical protein
MNMDSAAVFLAGSILTAMGFIVIVAAVVAVNNIMHRYWKPVRVFTEDSFKLGNTNARFVESYEFDKSVDPKLK